MIDSQQNISIYYLTVPLTQHNTKQIEIMKVSPCLPVLLAASLVGLFVTEVEGWSCLPPSPVVKKIKDISRKSFLVGAAGGFILGTTATAAGAAVAIDRNNASSKGPYEPPAGSLTDKVILITGGTAGLGLVRQTSLSLLKRILAAMCV